jgi:hypothetical protein
MPGFSTRSSCTALTSVGVILRPRITHAASISGSAQFNDEPQIDGRGSSAQVKNVAECDRRLSEHYAKNGISPLPTGTLRELSL